MSLEIYKAAKRRRHRKQKSMQYQSEFCVSPQTYGKLQKNHLLLQRQYHQQELINIKQKKEIDRLTKWLKEAYTEQLETIEESYTEQINKMVKRSIYRTKWLKEAMNENKRIYK